MDEKKSYYAIIPANVRYDADLTPNAKLLYGEITALCNEKGYCWASNDYFAKLYNVSKVSISKWVSALVKKGYIYSEITYRGGTKEILNRYLKLVDEPIKENFNTPIKDNLKDNNTLNNNTFNNTRKKERKTSYDEILSSIEDEDLKALYLDYIKMRKLIKAPMTDRALQMLIKKVNELEPDSIENQKKMLEIAIMNNWKSVYPIKKEANNVSGTNKRNGDEYAFLE
jgi:transposase